MRPHSTCSHRTAEARQIWVPARSRDLKNFRIDTRGACGLELHGPNQTASTGAQSGLPRKGSRPRATPAPPTPSASPARSTTGPTAAAGSPAEPGKRSKGDAFVPHTQRGNLRIVSQACSKYLGADRRRRIFCRSCVRDRWVGGGDGQEVPGAGLGECGVKASPS
jgi:hypothetical protein